MAVLRGFDVGSEKKEDSQEWLSHCPRALDINKNAFKLNVFRIICVRIWKGRLAEMRQNKPGSAFINRRAQVRLG